MVRLRSVCLLLIALAGVSAGALSAPRQRGAATPAPEAVPAPAGPQGEMRIAAVVNDEVISAYDLTSRIHMVAVSSNLPDTPEVRQRIAGQVLRSLIDEKLQLQEGKKQNVTATEEEINSALGQIEKQNNMQAGQLDAFLKQRGVDRNAIVSQVKASLIWAKLVRRMATQNTEISDEEIEETLKQLKQHATEPQSHVAEILLAVDNPNQEEEMRKLAEKLTEQMRQGARFSQVARQFSQASSAAVGGDLGWVRPDQMAPELGKAVANLKPGELSPPVRTASGFYLLLVLDRRNAGGGGGAPETLYDIVQVVLPLPAGASEGVRRGTIAEAEKMRPSFKDCPTMLKIGKEKAPQFSSEGRLRSGTLPAELRNLIEKQKVGEPSIPIVQKNGVGVVMVCSKNNEAAAGEVTRQEATEQLIKQRLDTLARRYIRDLRRAAYVDVRV
jgi:peptidyl-prolyl cis-trans isomerase SurA